MQRYDFIAQLNKLGFSKANPVQEKAIPLIRSGKDVLAIAPTGSGKTLAFILPLVHDLVQHPVKKSRSPEVLILVPTRELALQIKEVVEMITQQLQWELNYMAAVGGMSINPQMKGMFGVRLLIATPGRLLELLEKKALDLEKIKTLVLDEADKLLNSGFEKELDQILSTLPEARQNLLFSATLSEGVSNLETRLLKIPEVIKILATQHEEAKLNQTGYLVSEEKKGPLLRHLIRERSMKQVLVFTSSVAKADKVVNKLRKNKIAADAIHSKKSQGARAGILTAFKSGKLPVLVTTDLLSRGIDIQFLPYVINYELPRSPKDFVHRVGRTARAENPGEAIVFVTPKDQHHFKVIQKKMGRWVDMVDADNLSF